MPRMKKSKEDIAKVKELIAERKSMICENKSLKMKIRENLKQKHEILDKYKKA